MSTQSQPFVPRWILLRATKISGFVRQRYSAAIAIWTRNTTRKSHPCHHPIPAGRKRAKPRTRRKTASDRSDRRSTLFMQQSYHQPIKDDTDCDFWNKGATAG